MRVVPEAERLPRKCLVTGRANGPFVDFQVSVEPPNPNTPHQLYVHAGIVEEAAKMLGMVKRTEVDELKQRLHALSEQLDESRESMRVLGEFEEKFGPQRSVA